MQLVKFTHRSAADICALLNIPHGCSSITRQFFWSGFQKSGVKNSQQPRIHHQSWYSELDSPAPCTITILSYKGVALDISWESGWFYLTLLPQTISTDGKYGMSGFSLSAVPPPCRNWVISATIPFDFILSFIVNKIKLVHAGQKMTTTCQIRKNGKKWR